MEDKYVHNDMCRNRQDFNGCVLELFILSLICYRHDITEIVLKPNTLSSLKIHDYILNLDFKHLSENLYYLSRLSVPDYRRYLIS